MKHVAHLLSTRLRRFSDMPTICLSSIQMRPDAGASRPATHFSKVVFPVPLSPITAIVVPVGTSSDRLSRIALPSGNRYVSSSMRIMVGNQAGPATNRRTMTKSAA